MAFVSSPVFWTDENRAHAIAALNKSTTVTEAAARLSSVVGRVVTAPSLQTMFRDRGENASTHLADGMAKRVGEARRSARFEGVSVGNERTNEADSAPTRSVHKHDPMREGRAIANAVVANYGRPANSDQPNGETMGRIARAWPARQAAPLEPIVWISDVHAPYEDKLAISLACQVIEWLRPTHVVSFGDFADLHNVSRHIKDPTMRMPVAREIQLAGECRGRIDEACARAGVREKTITLGNHEVRLSKFLAEKAAELEGLIPSIAELLGFPQNGWHVVDYGEVHQIGNAFITHDLDRAGKYAHETSRVEMGGATLIGHTHRMALSCGGTYASGRHFAGMFGWLGDQQYAKYFKKPLRTQWQLGFGVGWLDPTTGYITNQPVPIIDGRCVVAGKVFGERAKAVA